MKSVLHFVVATCLSIATLTAQSVPSLMNYQGRLTDEASQPLINGTYAVQFRLWNRPTTNQPGETLVWGRQYDLTLNNGVFNVILGAPGGTPLPGTAVNDLRFAFGDAERYLGLTLARLHDGTVIGEAQRREILPRQQILSAPYSLESGRAHSLVKELADALCPPGSIMAFGGGTVPDGWLLCDGRAFNSSQYPRLWTAIGTSWGGSFALGAFNLPDLRGLFLRGVDYSPSTGQISGQDPDAAARTPIKVGGNPGNAVGSMQTDQLRSHRHRYSIVGQATSVVVPPQDGRFMLLNNDAGGTFFGGNGIENSGGSETRPKNAYVNYIIKY